MTKEQEALRREVNVLKGVQLIVVFTQLLTVWWLWWSTY